MTSGDLLSLGPYLLDRQARRVTRNGDEALAPPFPTCCAYCRLTRPSAVERAAGRQRLIATTNTVDKSVPVATAPPRPLFGFTVPMAA